MELGVPWDSPPAPSRTQDLARLLSGQKFPGLNIPPSIRSVPNTPLPPGFSGDGAAPHAAFMGVRAGMQPAGAPPVADMSFTATPQNFDPNANQAAAAASDRALHNDQPFDRTYGEGAQNHTFGEPATDPFASMDTGRAIQRFMPQQQPDIQQLMRMLANGQGTEA